MCPGSRSLSYSSIESDTETIDSKGAWVQDHLRRSSARLRIKEEVFDELLSILGEDKETQTNYGSYTPPKLTVIESSNSDIKRACQYLDATPFTGEQVICGEAQRTFENDLLERHVVVCSMDYGVQKTASGNDFSATDSPTLSYDDDELACVNKEGIPEEYKNVVGTWGPVMNGSNDFKIFQQASPRQSERTCLTIGEMKTSRHKMLQDENPRALRGQRL